MRSSLLCDTMCCVCAACEWFILFVLLLFVCVVCARCMPLLCPFLCTYMFVCLCACVPIGGSTGGAVVGGDDSAPVAGYGGAAGGCGCYALVSVVCIGVGCLVGG